MKQKPKKELYKLSSLGVGRLFEYDAEPFIKVVKKYPKAKRVLVRFSGTKRREYMDYDTLVKPHIAL